MLPQAALDRIAAECSVDLNRDDRSLGREELLSRVRGIDGLLCLLTDAIDGTVMDAAGANLKVIANYAVGFNNIDVAAASARHIPVTNTPGVLTEATADLTWALILDVVRRVSEGDRVMRAGRFPGWAPLYMLGGEVSGAVLGIVGLGRIGEAVARRAKGFGMRIIYFGPRRAAPERERSLGVEYRGFIDLLREADIISLHVPLNAETKHMFTEREFRRMKRTAYLVNTSRGPIVKEADLARALSEKLIAGAGLDVYEGEPAMHPGLAGLESAVLCPHLGSATLKTRGRMADIAVDNLLASLRGETPPNCVNREAL